MSRLLLDPTNERTVLQRTLHASAQHLARQDRRAARHLQAAWRRVLESGRAATDRARGHGAALQEADVHQAGPGRSPPRDRHAMRVGDRGPRRLRQLHVVQCARHRRSGVSRRARGVRRVRASSSTPRPPSRSHSAFPRSPGCSRRIRSKIEPTTRWSPTPTRPSTRSSPRSPPPADSAVDRRPHRRTHFRPAFDAE